jgi:putative transposase
MLSLQESRVTRSLTVVLVIVRDLITTLFRSCAALMAENLFLRRQLALYLERKTRRSRPSSATKFALVMLSRFFPWVSALAIVKPDTFVRWHRAGFRLFWRWKSRHVGRPPLAAA